MKHRADTGSSTPFILLCFLISAILVAGVTAASAAFLAQRDLQSACDGAAIAAASAIDVDGIYSTGRASDVLPLATEQAQAAVAEYGAIGFPDDTTLALEASVDAQQVTVSCNRIVTIPFGALFGQGSGLRRSTVSTARSPLLP